MSPFRSFYDNAFYKNLIVKDIISRTFNYVEEIGYLKTLIGYVWGMLKVRGGLVAL
jgi:hypothetical protein